MPPPPPVIIIEGQYVKVFFQQDPDVDGASLSSPHSVSSLFDASWLWQNCASNVMIPSGQKKGNSLVEFFLDGITIGGTAIQHISELERNIPSNDQEFSYKTEDGDVHPIRMKANKGYLCNEHDNNTGSKNFLGQFVLVIRWKKRKNCKQQVQRQEFAEEKKNDDDIFHESIFNMLWLRQWSYGVKSGSSLRDAREIADAHTFVHKYKSKDILFEERKDKHGPVTVDYNDALKSDGTSRLLDLLDAIFLDGAAIVSNAPAMGNELLDNLIVTNIGKAIAGGHLSHGALYGDTFQVKSTKNAINIAYTATELCPHQDLAYYESKPGFQLLHCKSVQVPTIGGESILIDCMAAAHTFRRLAPDLFETLVKCPATFVKDREGARMTYMRPHIVLHPDGGENADLNNMDREIVAVHWAPPFLGPLNIHPTQVSRYNKAYAAFELMLDNTKCALAYSKAFGIDHELATTLSTYASSYTWEKCLDPGDIMVFNNTRMLHGRRGFEVIDRKSVV